MLKEKEEYNYYIKNIIISFLIKKSSHFFDKKEEKENYDIIKTIDDEKLKKNSTFF